MARLHVSLPDGTEATHELTEELSTLGRVPDNTIQIDDASVSSHHAEIYLRGNSVVLKDIGSTNGTRINGEEVTPDEEHTLRGGEMIIFGSIPVRFLGDETAGHQPLPLESNTGLEPATTSVAPVDFSNASPFPKRSTQRDGASLAVMALGVLALLAAGGAIYLALGMEAPSL